MPEVVCPRFDRPRCVLVEVLNRGWRLPDLRLGPYPTGPFRSISKAISAVGSVFGKARLRLRGPVTFRPLERWSGVMPSVEVKDHYRSVLVSNDIVGGNQ
jgi:hypothetical protein